MHAAGRFLPSATIWCGTLCGADGRHIAIGDVSSVGGRARFGELLKEAWRADTVCGAVGISSEFKRYLEEEIGGHLCNGSLLAASLCLRDLTDSREHRHCRILLRGADSALGEVMASYLVGRVRFLSISGAGRARLLHLAHKLWQQEGIAVTIGDEADIVLTAQDMALEDRMVRVGKTCVSLAVAECALLAAMQADTRTITVDVLAQMVGGVRAYSVMNVGEKASANGKFD